MTVIKQDVILGVDPGFTATGFGIIERTAATAVLKGYGYLALPSSRELSHRIGLFYDFFKQKICDHNVTVIALETPFLGKNVQSFLKLGYLRGILYLLADQHKLSLYEFAPREVKATVTGFGAASKDQVAYMVMRLFPRIQECKATEKQDITDAIAVALCGFWSCQAAGKPGVAVR